MQRIFTTSTEFTGFDNTYLPYAIMWTNNRGKTRYLHNLFDFPVKIIDYGMNNKQEVYVEVEFDKN